MNGNSWSSNKEIKFFLEEKLTQKGYKKLYEKEDSTFTKTGVSKSGNTFHYLTLTNKIVIIYNYQWVC